MNTMPGFTAEVAFSKNKQSYRILGNSNRNDSSVVIPQLSCWRERYDISSTNHELVGCWRVCSRLKEVFGF